MQRNGKVGKYEYTTEQIEKWCVVLVDHCQLQSRRGTNSRGCCIGIRNMNEKISMTKWINKFAEYPEQDLKAYHIVFIISRGYFPIDLASHNKSISHLC